jgi:hypothetical protein
MHTMAVFGSGDVGEAVLRFSALHPGISKLWALDLDERRAEVAVNETAAIAAHRGRAPEFNWRTVDMTSREQIGEALAESYASWLALEGSAERCSPANLAARPCHGVYVLV